jgi:hypothetical protein
VTVLKAGDVIRINEDLRSWIIDDCNGCDTCEYRTDPFCCSTIKSGTKAVVIKIDSRDKTIGCNCEKPVASLLVDGQIRHRVHLWTDLKVFDEPNIKKPQGRFKILK